MVGELLRMREAQHWRKVIPTGIKSSLSQPPYQKHVYVQLIEVSWQREDGVFNFYT